MQYHNNGKGGGRNAFTKRANDWQMIYRRAFNAKFDALRFESKIKSMKSKEYIKKLVRNQNAWKEF